MQLPTSSPWIKSLMIRPSFFRKQIGRAEQAEITVRMHQVRAAQAEARTAAAISSEAVAHESLMRIWDQCMQEWIGSGTPVLAIGEAQVLIGTPVIGWGGLLDTHKLHPKAPKEHMRPQKGLPNHPERMGSPRMTTMTRCSFHWKHTPPRKMARPASSMP